ncbi:IS1595 family transposase [Cryobacterium sp. TMS1-20-1]|uniref:IS1595 family transposase n=1 Tax=Cryobacterium sp. TMS1-20-1 TaxID=1259223 RepID=UPI001F542BE9|nr:IS1595 family transposase [Cryobacterium sp. TMS1-20-1]
MTAATILDRTWMPLTVWFNACSAFATAKDGICALSLQRTLEIGSYQKAWAMLHRLRPVLIQPGRERLLGVVEVDEAFIGGEESGLAGSRAKGREALVCVAVELKSSTGFGRCRMAVIEDATASTVITDRWMGYAGMNTIGYVHDRRSQRAAKGRGEDPATLLLPASHRVAS